MQQLRQLGVAIRDVGGFLRQRLNHIAQSGKALVYGLRLLQPVARAARPSNPLGASQVDQVQLSCASEISHASHDSRVAFRTERANSSGQVNALHDDGHDEVGAAAVLVHVGAGQPSCRQQKHLHASAPVH